MVFYYPNQSVLTWDGEVGRVVYHNYHTHTVAVLVRVNDNTWVEKRYDETRVEFLEGFMWGMELPFRSKFFSRVQFYNYF